MSSSKADAAALEAAAQEVVAAAERALAQGATAEVSDAAVQRLLTIGARLFARKVEEERRYFMPISGPDAITPTDAAVLMTELLRTVNLNLFDLSMWMGRREGMDDAGAAAPGR